MFVAGYRKAYIIFYPSIVTVKVDVYIYSQVGPVLIATSMAKHSTPLPVFDKTERCACIHTF